MHLFRLLLTSSIAVALFAGCPGEEPADGPASTCDTSADCRETDSLGGLCVDGDCAPCVDAADCVADALYGEDATCIEGRCTVCAPGEVGCACLDDQYCVEGEGCRDGLCRPCDAGDALCGCSSNNDCGAGLVCQEGHCVDDACTPGVEGCPCNDDVPCADDFVCGDRVCRACPNDVVGCPCNDDGGCGEDLVCDNDRVTCRAATDCAELSCGTARLCNVSNGAAHCLDECSAGFQFDVATQSCVSIPGANCDAGQQSSILATCDAQHRDCIETGDTAACGACTDDAADCWVGPVDPAAGACREPTTCDSCAADNRTCTDNAGCGDVVCGDCVPGFFEYGGDCDAIVHVECDACDSVNRECLSDDVGNYCGHCDVGWREDADGTCVAVENCIADADNSILERCTDLARDCVEATADVPAHCDDCPAGTIVDPESQVCVDLGACFSRDDCNETAGLFCTQLGLADQPQCRPAACGAGETWNRASGTCTSCALTCANDPNAGTLGLWPATDRNGNCLCATADGFFWDAAASSGEAVACDKDGDGWLNEKIFEVFRTSRRSSGATRDDWSVILSVNCQEPVVDEVVLHNDWGQAHVLDVITDLGASGPVTLFETARNDRDDENLLRVETRAVNSLTKTCGGVLDDFNDNGNGDYNESQLARTTTRAWQGFFNQLTFFMELHTSSYDPATRRLTISERRRTEPSFPFHYFEGDDASAEHWRCCTRRRDSGYDVADQAGYDFASYSCDDTQGSCLYAWPDQWGRSTTALFPTPPPAVASVPVGAIPSYDACDLDRQAPADDVWRGMNHFSQFQCARVVNVAASSPIGVGDVRLSDLYKGALTPTSPDYVGSTAPWQLQQCTMDANGASACSAVATPAAVDASANSVRWLLRRTDNDYVYVPGGVDDYTGGCVDEWLELPELCPGKVDNPLEGAVLGDGDDRDFGELTCGCGEGYGGTDCERGCPDASIHIQTDYTPANRQGFWTCTDPAVSGFGSGSGSGEPTFGGTVDGDVWKVDATVPLGDGVGAVLEAPAGPASGFSIH